MTHKGVAITASNTVTIHPNNIPIQIITGIIGTMKLIVIPPVNKILTNENPKKEIIKPVVGPTSLELVNKYVKIAVAEDNIVEPRRFNCINGFSLSLIDICKTLFVIVSKITAPLNPLAANFSNVLLSFLIALSTVGNLTESFLNVSLNDK